jgi:hypothetical protein
MKYDIVFGNGKNFEVSGQFLAGTTQRQVAESYLKMSKIIGTMPSISVKTDVSAKGHKGHGVF